MVKKVIACICLALITIVPFLTAPTYAGEFERTGLEKAMFVSPRWSNINQISVILSFDNNGRGSLFGAVDARSGTSSISVDVSLDRVNVNGTLTNVARWNDITANGNVWEWERTHFVARHHDYRLTLTVTAVRNGVSETTTVSRDARAN